MPDAIPPGALRGKVILIAEDEYILARELEEFLQTYGATIAGPVGSVMQAMAIVEAEGKRLSAAILDVNLRGDRVYPVADALIDRGVPIIFTTGYDELLLAKPYISFPRCGKPTDKDALLQLLSQAVAGRDVT